MDDGWKVVLKGELGKLAPLLSFDKVQVNRAATKMHVILNSLELIPADQYRALARAFTAQFPGLQVTLSIHYPALEDSVREDLAPYRAFLLDIVGQEMPGARPYLHTAVWALEEDTLTISLADEVGAQVLEKKGVPAFLAGLMKEMFHVECRVVLSLTGDEKARLAAIAQQQQEK